MLCCGPRGSRTTRLTIWPISIDAKWLFTSNHDAKVPFQTLLRSIKRNIQRHKSYLKIQDGRRRPYWKLGPTHLPETFSHRNYYDTWLLEVAERISGISFAFWIRLKGQIVILYYKTLQFYNIYEKKKNRGVSVNHVAKVPFGIEAPQDHRIRKKLKTQVVS